MKHEVQCIAARRIKYKTIWNDENYIDIGGRYMPYGGGWSSVEPHLCQHCRGLLQAIEACPSSSVKVDDGLIAYSIRSEKK